MMGEPFFYIDSFGTVDDFCELLLVDVAERDLSAMVEAAGDYTTIVENRHMRIKRTACTGNDFASLVFALRARLVGSVMKTSKLIFATLASFVFRLSSII